MSGLAKIFGGGKKTAAAPTSQEAIQKLRETEEMLNKKTAHLEKKIEGELMTAKKNASTKDPMKKRIALSALKRKKVLEKQLMQIDGTLTTIENQRMCLENASTNAESVRALQFGNKAIQDIQSKLGVDDIHDLMDDIAEGTTVANEIGEALAGGSGAYGVDYDEDELNQELEDLEQEDFDQKIIEINTPDLPSVPTTDLPTKPKVKEADDEDMAALEAWAS